MRAFNRPHPNGGHMQHPCEFDIPFIVKSNDVVKDRCVQDQKKDDNPTKEGAIFLLMLQNASGGDSSAFSDLTLQSQFLLFNQPSI